MSTIAVVGHRGFVGRAVMEAARRHEHDARAIELPRITGVAEPSLRAAVDRWRDADPTRAAALVDTLRGCDSVVNAAGAATPDSDDRDILWAANVLLPAVVAAAALEAGVRRMVHVSSAAVQGDRAILDESLGVDPQSPYAASKAEAESALLDRSIQRPDEVVVYRPTSVMGPDRPTTQRMLALFRRAVPTTDRATPLPVALVANIGDAAAFLATVEHPPKVVTHPSEGITVGALAAIAHGRVLRVPSPVVDAGVAALRRFERARPGLAGVRRRVQLLTQGQEVEAQSLEHLGWTPPVGIEGYRELIRPGRGDHIRLAYLITRSDTIAGAQVHVRDLSEAMTQAGHTVRVFVGGNGPLADQLRDRGVDVHPIMSLERELGPADARALLDIRRALKEFDPDLLSCHSSKSGILGRIAGRTLGIPTIFTAHGWSFADGIPDRQRRVFLQLERAMAPLAAKLITVAHADRELAMQQGVGRPEQHVTIHNAVHDVRPDQIADPSIEPPTIVSIARLDDQKDHPLLLRAIAELDPTPHVQLVGDGPKEQELRALANDLGIADHVDFLGLRHDVPDLLAGAQIYVLASNWEGLPRSIIEALRAGLPVIATDVGGVRELVDEENGHLLPHNDLDALEKALLDLLSDADRRGRLGENSRTRYDDHFTFERVLAETRSVYRSLLEVAV